MDIPERELLIWQDSKLRASLERGIKQAEDGELIYLGDFSQYLNDEEDTDA